MNGDVVAAIIVLAACMVLALRGFRSYRMTRGRTLAITAIWVAVIAGLAIVLQHFAP